MTPGPGILIFALIIMALFALGASAAIWAIKQIRSDFKTKEAISLERDSQRRTENNDDSFPPPSRVRDHTKLVVAVLVLAFLAFILRSGGVGWLGLPIAFLVAFLVLSSPIWGFWAIERIRRRFAPKISSTKVVVAVIVLAILAGNIDKLF